MTDTSWTNPIEENQWMVTYSMGLNPVGEADEDPKDATVYVREGPPPGAVKIWNGTGKRNAEAEERENVTAGEPQTPSGLQPFLFAPILLGRVYSEYGKLDDKAKAMLKDKFNVDVDADG